MGQGSRAGGASVSTGRRSPGCICGNRGGGDTFSLDREHFSCCVSRMVHWQFKQDVDDASLENALDVYTRSKDMRYFGWTEAHDGRKDFHIYVTEVPVAGGDDVFKLSEVLRNTGLSVGRCGVRTQVVSCLGSERRWQLENDLCVREYFEIPQGARKIGDWQVYSQTLLPGRLGHDSDY